MGDHSQLPALLLSMFLLLALLASPPAMTGGVVMPQRSAPPEIDAPARVLVTPMSARANTLVRQFQGVDIRHEFNLSFSADVAPALIPRLRLYAQVEPVGVFDLQSNALTVEDEVGGVPPGGLRAEPVCGDDRCQGDELSSCVDDCKRFRVRSCVPSAQRGRNVIQVGGGKEGDGEGVAVAVIDSGAAINHLDLRSNVRICVDTTRVGVQSGCHDDDTVSHGTHAAGIIAADGGSDGQGMFGVAPSASILVIKSCRSSVCLADDVAEGIDFAAEKGAQIISMSFGAAREDRLVRDAIQRHPEVLFVASAGNAGPAPDSIVYPAAQPEVIGVAAIDKDGVPAWFSSRGITDGDDAAVSAREVEFSVGGVDVEGPSADGCFSRLSGTSFSAPAIAGLAAKVWDRSDGSVDGRGDARSVRRFLWARSKLPLSLGAGRSSARFDTGLGYGVPSVS